METGAFRLSRKGRGAVSNPSGRFETERRVDFDDGWGGLDEPLPPLRTRVEIDATRTIITRNLSPDVPFDRSINPYRGCEHGCIYCFARPSHGFLGLSSGQDFETHLFAKPDAPVLLARELRRSGYVCRVMALGTNTDPYQPIERTRRITRGILEVLSDFNHPVAIVTKGTLVCRDIDILAPMAARGLARVHVSITTLDRDLARRLEPRAPTSARRLAAIAALAEAGVPVGVMVAPIIPALTDDGFERVLEAAAGAGARSAGYVLLRLPYEVADLFREWLALHAPERARRVMALVRETHGGRDYDSRWRRRMTGQGPYARLIAARFALACRRLGIAKRDWSFDTGRFRPPPRAGDQLGLFPP